MPIDSANAMTYFFDDFEDGDATDGSPVTWVSSESKEHTVAVQDIDSPPDGELEYTRTWTGSTSIQELFSWPEEFTAQDLSIRAQLRLFDGDPNGNGSDGGGIVARVHPWIPDSPDGYRQYYAYVWRSPTTSRTALNLASWDGFNRIVRDPLAQADIDLDVTQEDVVLQFDLIGTEISARVWRPGEPMPDSPQVSTTVEWVTTGGISFWSFDRTAPDRSFTSALRWLEATAYSPADFNLDLAVDAQDLDIWQNRYGSPGQREHGDANGDGLVTGADYLIWQREYVAVVPGLAVELGVPEPSTLLLVAIACAGLITQNRFRP